MKKFEYKTEHKHATELYPFLGTFLNEEGADGWELVAVIEKDQDTDFFFKREIIEVKVLDKYPTLRDDYVSFPEPVTDKPHNMSEAIGYSTIEMGVTYNCHKLVGDRLDGNVFDVIALHKSEIARTVTFATFRGFKPSGRRLTLTNSEIRAYITEKK